MIMPVDVAQSLGERRCDPEAPSERRLPGERIESLDALRGLAALSVVFAHVLWFLKGDTPLRSQFQALAAGDIHGLSPAFLWELSPLHLLTAGHEAVVLFFMLSGFVIYLPWEAENGLTYRTYAVRRICRIYLPYLVAVFAAMVLNATVSSGGLPEMNSWFNHIWKVPVRGEDVLAHMAMIGSFNTDAFLPPIWSLVHEMRISLVFPVLAVLVRRRANVLPVAALLAMAGLLADRFWGGTENNFNNYFVSIHYAALFLFGGWLASRRNDVKQWYARFSPQGSTLLLAASVLVYTYGRFAFLLWPTEPAFPDLAIAAGALGILVWALMNPCWFQSGPVQWLGKVSYGLYLVHFTVFLSAIYLLHRFLPLWTILVIALPLALAASHIFWRLVELPSIRLGRVLTQ